MKPDWPPTERRRIPNHGRGIPVLGLAGMPAAAGGEGEQGPHPLRLKGGDETTSDRVHADGEDSAHHPGPGPTLGGQDRSRVRRPSDSSTAARPTRTVIAIKRWKERMLDARCSPRSSRTDRVTRRRIACGSSLGRQGALTSGCRRGRGNRRVGAVGDRRRRRPQLIAHRADTVRSKRDEETPASRILEGAPGTGATGRASAHSRTVTLSDPRYSPDGEWIVSATDGAAATPPFARHRERDREGFITLHGDVGQAAHDWSPKGSRGKPAASPRRADGRFGDRVIDLSGGNIRRQIVSSNTVHPSRIRGRSDVLDA